MKLLISAGEASGERYGAELMEALRRRDASLEFMGVGGERMRGAGCATVVDARAISVVGLGEVVTHLPRIWREFRRLLRAIDEQRPAAAVLIDFPDWNFRLARELHHRNIPVIYYVSPQLWAWRPRRIALVKRYVRKMLVIFPFEERWYRERGVDAEFVGHPLADASPPAIARGQFAREHGLDPAKQWIALLPGSRRNEVIQHLRVMVEAAVLLGSGYQYVVPVASTLSRQWVERKVEYECGDIEGPLPPEKCARFRYCQDAGAALAHARAAIVASGTATVEAAVIGAPFVMVYRVSPLTWLLGRRLVKVPHFAMVNLIAGRAVVPELVQNDFNAKQVVARLREVLPQGAPRAAMLAGLAEVREKLAAGAERPAMERAADVVLAAIGC